MKPSPSRTHPTTRTPRRLTALLGIPILALAGTLLPVGATHAEEMAEDLAIYVDPLVGTSNAGNTHPGAVAPFGMVTWGPDQSYYNGPTAGANAGRGTMRTPAPSGYEYGSTSVRGFSLTHVSGAGCTGLSGDIPFMPWSGEVTTSPSSADATASAYRSNFSHDNEKAVPGRYSVDLDSGVGVDLAATTRSGAGHFTYPENQSATMLVRTSDSLVGSSDARISIDRENRTITGSVTSGNFCGPFTGDAILQRSYYTVHFVAEFDTDFTQVGTWNDSEVSPGSTSASGGTGYSGGLTSGGGDAKGYPPAGRGSGGWVQFADHDVSVRVGVSYVSEANARENLESEQGATTTVDEVAAGTRDAWRRELGRVAIEGGTADERTTFYTALYHSLLHPNITSDVNGDYTGFDMATHTVARGQGAQYATFSGWDVYRSQVQLVTLLDAGRGSDIAASLLNQADQNGGVWDRWTHNSGAVHVMVGDPSAVALAGIVAFGGTDFPVERAFDSLAQAARVPTELDLTRRGWNVAVEGQRPSLDQFLAHGFYPEGCNAWACANETLEMAAADYALSTLAEKVGDEDARQEFVARSQSWQKQFNPDATPQGGYIQRRMSDGSWVGEFDPASSAGFVEGTGAQYVWMVQHDIAGLFDAMGGNGRAVERLDAFFKDPSGNWVLTGSWDDNVHANMDNEPSVATPWLYNYAGAPWKTQQTVRETIKRLWLTSKDGIPNGPDGIPGNDDLGAMSSWLVFAAMGIYPQNPSRAELTMATPMFPGITLTRADGTVLSINTPGATIDTPYISSMTLDGRTSTSTYLPADVLSRDTRVEIVPSATPNTSRGTAAEDAPPSVREGEVTDAVTLSTTSAQVFAGGSTGAVTVSARQLVSSATGDLTFTVEAPEGLVPSRSAGTLTSTGQGRASTDLSFSADQDLALGQYPVTVTVSRAGEAVASLKLVVDVVDHTTTLLSTSYENGQPRPTPNTRIHAEGFGDYCCGIGGVETKVQDGESRSGSQAVIYSARAVQEGATAANLLLDGAGTVVPHNARLTYSVRPQKDGGPFGDYVQDASQFVAVDLLYTDGSTLGATGVVTSNGATLDPLEQGKVLKVDTWNDVSVSLPDSEVGKTVDKVVLTLATGKHSATPGARNGYLRGWIDDLSLVAAVAPLEVEPTDGLSLQAGQEFTGRLAEFTGGRGTAPSDFTATVDWGDGSALEQAVVTDAEPGSGGGSAARYGVEATHAYGSVGSHTLTLVVTDADGVSRTTTLPVNVTQAPVVWAPEIQATPPEVTAGTTLTVSGSGFAPAETVLVELSTTPVLTASAVVDAEGQMTAILTVPATTPAGDHQVTATGSVSMVPAVAAVKVLERSGPGPVQEAGLNLSSDTVPLGSAVRALGHGFQAGETVRIGLEGASSPLATVVANASGSFTQVLVIPLDTPIGAHRVDAEGTDSGVTASADLTVTAAAEVPGSPGGAQTPGTPGTPARGGNADALARTGFGSSIGAGALAVAVSLLTGASLLAVRRRGGTSQH